MSTYSAMLWTEIFPPHPPYPQPSFACWWLGRFLCQLQFVPSLRVNLPGWHEAWRRHSGGSTPPRRVSAWPAGGTLGPKHGTGMWQSYAPATGHQVWSQTQRRPEENKERLYVVFESYNAASNYSWGFSSPVWCPPAPPCWQSLPPSTSLRRSSGSQIHHAEIQWPWVPAPPQEWLASHSVASLRKRGLRAWRIKVVSKTT